VTTDWRETAQCPNCGTHVATEQPIKTWIRKHEDLDSREKCLWIGDSDLWVHKWAEQRTRHRGYNRDIQRLMLCEVKTYWRDMDESQRDTMWNIDRLLRTKAWKDQRLSGMFAVGHLQNVRVVYGLRAGKPIVLHCYGVHKLRMDGPTPDASNRLEWDNKKISVEQLLQLLAFEISPDTFKPIEDRVHKRLVDQPTLELPWAMRNEAT
jgi:hypothetical protein